MNFRSSKFALLLGAINGFLFGVAYQPVSNARLFYNNNLPRSGISIHSVKGATPLQEYLFLILLFMAASYAAHRFFAAKIKSDIILWQVIAITAIVGLSVVIYFLKQTSYFIGAAKAKIERGEWGYLPGLLPSQNDIEYGILFLCLAITINFFYGVIIENLSNHFAK